MFKNKCPKSAQWVWIFLTGYGPRMLNQCCKLRDCYFAEANGRDVVDRDHKDRKVEREKLPVMEVQREARFNGAWFVGFHSRRPRNSSCSRCICSCKECFSPSIWQSLFAYCVELEKDLQVHISSVTDPLAAWKILQKQFEFVSVTQIVRLNR